MRGEAITTNPSHIAPALAGVTCHRSESAAHRPEFGYSPQAMAEPATTLFFDDHPAALLPPRTDRLILGDV